MNCPSQIEIQAISRRLADGAWTGEMSMHPVHSGHDEQVEQLLAVAGDLEEFQKHVRVCGPCRDAVAYFLEAELVFRRSEGESQRELEKRPERCVLRLNRVVIPNTDDVLPVAADDGVTKTGDLKPSYVSYRSEEGLEVRVYPNVSGGGSTATCATAETTPMALVVDGVRYPFDEEGQADLPSGEGDVWELEIE